MKLFKFLAVSLLALSMIGCSALEKATLASNLIGDVLTVAEAEKSSVNNTSFDNFVDLGNTLQEQLNGCISGVSSSKAGSFLACFNSFASGLTSSTELAQLRVSDAATQHSAQIIITAIITGVNVGVKTFSGTLVTTPVVGTPATAAELNAVRAQLGR